MSAALTRLTDAGTLLENVGVVCMVAAVLLRAPAALRSPPQRGIWLAVAAAAAAMALNRGIVCRFVNHAFGQPHLTAAVTSLCGVLSSAAVLDFVIATTGNRQRRAGGRLAAAAVMAAMVLLDLTAPWNAQHTVLDVSSPQPSLAYWLIVIGAHLTANAACVRVCWRYGRYGPNRALRIGLALFGLGTAFAGTYWLLYLLYIPLRANWIPALLPLLMGLHSLLRTAALTLPLLANLRRTAAELRTLHQLWPLWRDLVDAVPQVALADPRPRLLEMLQPRGAWNYLVYRKVMEIRDAILVLRDYAPPAPATSRTADPVALAALLRQARGAKLGGRPPRASAGTVAEMGGHDLATETRFLVEVARAYAATAANGAVPRPPIGSSPRTASGVPSRLNTTPHGPDNEENHGC
ncbi:MAB_1171c family putative transporter [Streptomyces sp. RPT161]|uniref:MAB_1171c family putative transporter n=1 Tax=Streptomyces sp. RPT161 TaxID=3015993 RepID=UPI0022B894A5|nr:MAB_1171c family putative transporter [Streptomyces sp. RPT161]